jgi:hypothetical protein
VAFVRCLEMLIDADNITNVIIRDSEDGGRIRPSFSTYEGDTEFGGGHLGSRIVSEFIYPKHVPDRCSWQMHTGILPLLYLYHGSRRLLAYPYVSGSRSRICSDRLQYRTATKDSEAAGESRLHFGGQRVGGPNNQAAVVLYTVGIQSGTV